MISCPGLDFTQTCTRLNWAGFLPIAILAFYLLLSTARFVIIPRLYSKYPNWPVLAHLSRLLSPWLTLDEALTFLLPNNTSSSSLLSVPVPTRWCHYYLVPTLSLLQCLAWITIACYDLMVYSDHILLGALQYMFIAISWLYSALRPLYFPSKTVMYDLFFLHVAHMFGGVLLFFNTIGSGSPPWTMLAILNIVVITINLSLLLSMPMLIPDPQIPVNEIGKSISPEDYTTFYRWITFTWVYPLIRQGRDTTLKESDVYEMSPTLQAKPLFLTFNQTISGETSLAWHIFWCNSRDIIIDFIGSFLTVLFNYGSPFFLKKILDTIDSTTNSDGTPKTPDQLKQERTTAYIYAIAMFACNLLKAQSDVQHLWFGRRASTRIRSELMSAIYDKSLKRVCLQSSTPSQNQEPSSPTSKTDKKSQPVEVDPKSGADLGKIVNLMAVDSSRVAMLISGLYFVYQAPFEIIFASTMLYQLLGWPAFTGFLALILTWPINNFLSKRMVLIYKSLSSARDKRMSVLNELISSVKFIKFFAWEEKWIERALNNRNVELNWIKKGRINSVLFALQWGLAPTFISVISFFVYVMLGNKLTVGTAFTAIALFNMIRTPLNILPTYLVQVLQTRVSLQRISMYLAEEEVSAQVSSLKSSDDNFKPQDEDTVEPGIGLQDATLRWNEVQEDEKSPKSEAAIPVPSNRWTWRLSWRQSTNVAISEPDNGVTPSDAVSAEVDTSSHKFELRDISVMFPEGKLSLIVGPTASGKTAVLMALLGEMTLLSGRLILSKNSTVDEYGLTHSISYAAQLPWLRHQSIRENILFGNEYEAQRYNDVLQACALRPDLEVLDDGDLTEIGSRGVSLSGGQKARVALARAVYARTKYVLLDDPLSAVDSHTSRFLFEKLLCGPLLEHRTVILVTHHVELVLPGAYYIVRMLDGRVDTHGIVTDLQAQGVLDDIVTLESLEIDKTEPAAETPEQIANETEAAAIEGGDEAELAKTPRQLVKDEHREVGGVKWSVYKTYLEACSYWVWAFLVLLVILNQLFGLSERIWIDIWGEAYKEDGPATSSALHFTAFVDQQRTPDDLSHSHSMKFTSLPFKNPVAMIEWPSAVQHPLFYVGVYAALCIVHGLFHATAAAAQYWGALRASRLLFKKLLVTVVQATFRFHDTTPAGRLLNRFGKDMETIDGQLATSLDNVNSSLASFFVSALTIIVVFPIFVLPAFILGFLYRKLAIGYLRTGRDLRRMESNSRSPIFSDFGELLEGIVTVRAFSKESSFRESLFKKVDMTTKMFYTFWMTNRWLLLNFDSLGAVAIFCTSLLCVTYLQGVAGLAGICITSALSFTMSVYWACRFYTTLELDLNSVERITEYLNLPQEPPAIIESNRPPAYWPSSSPEKDLIVVEDLTVKYSPELPAVLKDISFSLKGGERIGLLGRTGSGKSTLAMSFLRFVDPSSGRILIDGLDISTIGVQDLRSRITFIPQDATLFSGTLRDNLDPFGEHDDSECLDVLYRVHLIQRTPLTSAAQSRIASREPSRPSTPMSAEGTVDSISTATQVDSKPTISLSTQVTSGGTNFSQGQRQLIAMARALLRQSSIIILDEATSSIDFATDAKIQATIREEFTHALLLTVAHRLRTVIDYDKLIVLDKGQIAELDTPLALIEREDSIFHGMCMKSGTFKELKLAARAKAAGA